jgi:hypothetical protein
VKTSVNSKIIFPDIWSVSAYTVTYNNLQADYTDDLRILIGTSILQLQG